MVGNPIKLNKGAKERVAKILAQDHKVFVRICKKYLKLLRDCYEKRELTEATKPFNICAGVRKKLKPIKGSIKFRKPTR